MDLQHISVKLFANEAGGFDMAALIPIFHGWIQRGVLDELTLFDVADYAHVHHGPGVMLICHEGHFAMDQDGGRMGLLYSNKRLATGTVQDRLRAALRRLLMAARLLEIEPDLGGKIAFACDELLIRIDDHLHTPNDVETYRTLEPDLQQVLTDFYTPDPVDLRHITDRNTALEVESTTTSSADVETLLGRLAGA